MKKHVKNHMKKTWTPLLALTLALELSACANSPGGGRSDTGGTPVEKNPDHADITSPAAPAPLADAPETPDHVHAPADGGNVAEHEPAGYCGNTVTTVSRGTGDSWEISFEGSDSVALTDLLLYLDYSGDICRCLPEYTVNTEFGSGYGVNLTEGYARYDGGQTDLTEEQIMLIREILDRQS